ncbi:MAG: hypothetical protein IJD07_03220, partial [Clostridia bacterium]|nr:hypothetical protein [Clostridia bacterium]
RMNDFWRDGRYEGTDNGFYDDNDGENSDDSSQGSAKNGMSRDRVNDGKGLFDRIRDSVDDRDDGDINESDDSRNREVDGEIVDDGSGNNPDGDTRVIVGDNNITPPPPNVDQIVPFAIDFAK